MSFPDIMRPPDRVTAYLEQEAVPLAQRDEGTWAGGGVELQVRLAPGRSDLVLSAPGLRLKQAHLRWEVSVPSGARFLGDQWERSYFDLEWRAMVPDRLMPWYFLACDGKRTHGCGVKTSPAAFCWWMADPNGISLWLDLRCGGCGVELGDRSLDAATIVTRQGREGESPFEAATAFARLLCDHPRLPSQPIYGSNNWYHCGPHTSAEKELESAKRLMELAPAGENPPCSLIDFGWSLDPETYGPWDKSNDRFPDMPALAREIRDLGARPGIWVRLLAGSKDDRDSLFLPEERFRDWPKAPAKRLGLDPSLPEVRARVSADVRRLTEWGFTVIKHDFSAFDLLGRWGFEMYGHHNRLMGLITNSGWSFSDRSRTTAEIITDFYRAIREAAGEAIVLGCNTFGHLAAGLVELQRSADDNSGTNWTHTRKMGLNTLAFRMPQHRAFFLLDPDVVPVTPGVPWPLTRQWLQVVSESGAVLFVSADPEALGEEEKQALRKAYAFASKPQPPGEPLDWLETTCPERWKLNGKVVEFDWYRGSDVNPFSWK
jgi:alpha-galactosidase